jgi:hypothetical protein
MDRRVNARFYTTVVVFTAPDTETRNAQNWNSHLRFTGSKLSKAGLLKFSSGWKERANPIWNVKQYYPDLM